MTVLDNLLSNEDPVGFFISNLQPIFARDSQEIVDALEKLPLDTILSIREQVFVRAETVLSCCLGQRLCSRRSSNLAANDVYVIGLSAINKIPDSRLKTLLRQHKEKSSCAIVPNYAIDENQPSTLADLLEVCSSLKRTVDDLKEELFATQARVALLEDETTTLRLAAMTAQSTNENIEAQEETNPLLAVDEDDSDDEGEGQIAVADSTPEAEPERVVDPAGNSATSTSTSTNAAATSSNNNSRQRSRKRKKNNNLPPVITSAIIGTGSPSSGVTSNPQTRVHIYVGKLDRDFSTDSLRKHLTGKVHLKTTDLIDITQLRRFGFSSFKVTLATQDALTKVFQPSRWPQNALVKLFEERAPRASRGFSHSGSHQGRSHQSRGPNRYSWNDSYSYPNERWASNRSQRSGPDDHPQVPADWDWYTRHNHSYEQHQHSRSRYDDFDRRRY
jgi:hypothetical protein